MKGRVRFSGGLNAKWHRNDDLISVQNESEEPVSTQKYATLDYLQTAYAATVKFRRWFAQITQKENNYRFGALIALCKGLVPLKQVQIDRQAMQEYLNWR